MMFDFQNLEIYRKARDLYGMMRKITSDLRLTDPERGQLLRASLSIVLNIAEGAGRLGDLDKRRFYVFARGSVYECVAIADVLLDQKMLNDIQHSGLCSKLEELSKMLYGLIRNRS